MQHVVLLGDSIFDNAAYVAGGPDVAAQLRERLPDGWDVTLLAVDGHVTRSVPDQLRKLPATATHLVLSVGGNDALGYADIVSRPARSAAEVLDLLADIGSRFAADYARAVDLALRPGLPLTLCTIYEGALSDADFRRRALVALSTFNEVIVRTAIRHGLDLIDLREVCSDPGDYANPIEPSVQGGARIAAAIARAVGAVADGARRTSVTS